MQSIGKKHPIFATFRCDFKKRSIFSGGEIGGFGPRKPLPRGLVGKPDGFGPQKSDQMTRFPKVTASRSRGNYWTLLGPRHFWRGHFGTFGGQIRRFGHFCSLGDGFGGPPPISDPQLVSDRRSPKCQWNHTFVKESIKETWFHKCRLCQHILIKCRLCQHILITPNDKMTLTTRVWSAKYTWNACSEVIFTHFGDTKCSARSKSDLQNRKSDLRIRKVTLRIRKVTSETEKCRRFLKIVQLFRFRVNFYDSCQLFTIRDNFL